jgi:hypothetical protein
VLRHGAAHRPVQQRLAVAAFGHSGSESRAPRGIEQMTLPATWASGHEEAASMVPPKERKSVESTVLRDPAAMRSKMPRGHPAGPAVSR